MPTSDLDLVIEHLEQERRWLRIAIARSITDKDYLTAHQRNRGLEYLMQQLMALRELRSPGSIEVRDIKKRIDRLKTKQIELQDRDSDLDLTHEIFRLTTRGPTSDLR